MRGHALHKSKHIQTQQRHRRTKPNLGFTFTECIIIIEASSESKCVLSLFYHLMFGSYSTYTHLRSALVYMVSYGNEEWFVLAGLFNKNNLKTSADQYH